MAIVDFDRAEIGATKDAQNREEVKLEALLDGDYVESDGSPSRSKVE